MIYIYINTKQKEQRKNREKKVEAIKLLHLYAEELFTKS